MRLDVKSLIFPFQKWLGELPFVFHGAWQHKLLNQCIAKMCSGALTLQYWKVRIFSDRPLEREGTVLNKPSKAGEVLSCACVLFQLWLDSCVVPPSSPPPKEEDFFASHASPEVCVMLYIVLKCAPLT